MLKRIWSGMILLLAATSASGNAREQPCHSGAWRLPDGRLVTLMPSGDEGALRYRLLDGTSGRLFPAGEGHYAGGPGFSSAPPPTVAELRGGCGEERLTLQLPGMRPAQIEKLRLETTETEFRSGDLLLRGRLVRPPGDGPFPLVVLVQGSGDYSAVRFHADQYMLPTRGIAVFVYDKRGAGRSEGSYTQDFHALAGDAAAAMAEARRMLGPQVTRAGYWGSSQGGWVAPLAARSSGADFLIVSYGLAHSPAREDQEEVDYRLAQLGYGPGVRAKAREVTAATARVMASGFTGGFEELADAKRRYGTEPWFAQIEGEYSGELLQHPEAALRAVGPTRDRGTPWKYDPLPVLRELRMPALWILAEEDDEAPIGPTLSILRDLQRGRPELDIAVYPGTTHGMLRFKVDAAGERVPTGYARSYFDLVSGWIDGRLLRPDDARILAGSEEVR